MMPSLKIYFSGTIAVFTCISAAGVWRMTKPVSKSRRNVIKGIQTKFGTGDPKKTYEVDPLLCPKCHGSMKIISIIDQAEIIQKILRHLNLWDTRNHDPPPEGPSYIPELIYDDSDTQIPAYNYWD